MMKFEWNQTKAILNLKKHGVSFDIAVTVFDDPLHLSVLDSRHDGEDRWVTIGLSIDREALVVVHTVREIIENIEIFRVISARKATPKERRQYEKGI